MISPESLRYRLSKFVTRSDRLVEESPGGEEEMKGSRDAFSLLLGVVGALGITLASGGGRQAGAAVVRPEPLPFTKTLDPMKQFDCLTDWSFDGLKQIADDPFALATGGARPVAPRNGADGQSASQPSDPAAFLGELYADLEQWFDDIADLYDRQDEADGVTGDVADPYADADDDQPADAEFYADLEQWFDELADANDPQDEAAGDDRRRRPTTSRQRMTPS